MNIKRKLLIGIFLGLSVLAGIFMLVKNTFFSNPSDGMNSAENMAVGPDGQPIEGGSTYSIYNLFLQDPVTVDASVKLSTDTAYFLQPDLGEIESILVKDGQKVTKGTVLYNYKQTSKENQYALEDLRREQTKLYNARQDLIKQLSDFTGGEYNYQGDQISYYWGNDGKQVYYIVAEIGKSTTSSATASNTGQVSQDSPSGASDMMAVEEEAAGMTADPSEGLKEQIRQVNDQIEELEIKLIRQQEQANNKVLAKTDGIVMVNPEGKENQSVPVVRIVSEGSSVVGSVTEYDFYALAEDREVRIYIPAEDRTVTGKIVEYDKIPSYSGGASSQNDASSQAMGVSSPGGGNSTQFNFVVKPDEPLQPGFSAKVNITLPGYAIPTDTIVEEGENSYVFLYKDGKAVKTKVDLLSQGLQKVVLKGLNEGDQLIMFPYDLTDGQEVTIIDPMAVAPDDAMMGEGGQ